MRWPPNKAWTSSSEKGGYRHFVAINYGGKRKDRWVNLVAVLDGEVSMRIPWEEMKDTEKWQSGWLQLPREESLPLEEKIIGNQDLDTEKDLSYLEPSEDSGLLIPFEVENVRPWTSE